MREQLIRYLLGELDEFEHRELRAKLESSPELQRELAHLRECFAANKEADAEPRLPNRLAERTTERITSCEADDADWVSPGTKTSVASGDSPAGVLGWSLADLTVAGGVMLALSMLMFPALRDSRDGTRRNVCQNNQREMWVLVSKYARDHGGYYPQVRPNENAGVFAARLVQKGYVEPEELEVLLVCPASPVANEIRAGRLVFHLPSREELRSMAPAELLQVTAGASPSYGYRLPQRVGDDYVYLRDDRSGHSGLNPIFGDISGDVLNAMSANHSGSVIQVVCRDGSVRSFTTSTPPGLEDLYHNDLGIVAAALGPHDVVLAPGHATPGLEFAALEK